MLQQRDPAGRCQLCVHIRSTTTTGPYLASLGLVLLQAQLLLTLLC